MLSPALRMVINHAGVGVELVQGVECRPLLLVFEHLSRYRVGFWPAGGLRGRGFRLRGVGGLQVAHHFLELLNRALLLPLLVLESLVRGPTEADRANSLVRGSSS